MDVPRFCASVIDRVFTSTRTDCTATEKYDIHAWLADYFGQKANDLAVEEPVEVSPTELCDNAAQEAVDAAPVEVGRVSNPDE